MYKNNQLQTAIISKNINHRSFFLWFLLIAITITCFRFLLLRLQIWPLSGDEAQYWDWSKHFAFGYYSKPPLLAWIIAISTNLFGNNVFAIRLVSPICHFFTAIILFFCGKKLFDTRTGFWSGITYLLLPGVTFSADIGSTDPVLLLFWSATLYFFIQAIFDNKKIYWFCCGISFGFAMLSKYTAIFLPLSAVLYLLCSNKNRHFLTDSSFYWSGLIGFLILVPNIIWNINHHFASIHAVQANAAISGLAFHFVNMFNFLLSQFALVGPIVFFVICLLLLFRPWLIRQDERYLLLLSFVWPLLLVMAIEALLSNAHANWAVAIYTSGIIAVSAYLIQKQQIKLLWLSLILNLAIFIGFFQTPHIIRTLGLKLPVETEMLDWPSAGQKIARQLQNHPQTILVVDDRMLLALTMYYGHIPQNKVVEWNPAQKATDQYTLITNLAKYIGQNAILITYWSKPTRFIHHFSKVTLLEQITEPTLDGRTNSIYLYYGQNFLGYHAKQS